jgi:hypothetical protein
MNPGTAAPRGAAFPGAACAAVLAVLSVCAVPAPVFGTAGDTLALLGSARSAAIAADVAAGGGIVGMQTNVASLASQEGWAVSGTWLAWLEGARVGQLSVSAPTAAGVVGLSFGGVSAGRVDVVEDAGPVRTVDAQQDTVVAAGLARRVGAGFEAGIACKWYRSALAESWVATASALDAGARFTSAGGDMSMGLAVGNAVATRLNYADERRVLPRAVAAGVAWRPVRTAGLGVLLAAEHLELADAPAANCAGVELELAKTLALRGGVRRGGGVSALSAGIGAAWKRMRFDYAVASPARLGTVSRATMTMMF